MQVTPEPLSAPRVLSPHGLDPDGITDSHQERVVVVIYGCVERKLSRVETDFHQAPMSAISRNSSLCGVSVM